MTAEAAAGLGLVGGRFLHDLALMIAFGMPAFGAYAQPALSASTSAWIRKLVPAAGIASLAGAVLWFLFTAAAMSGSLAGAADANVLSLVAFRTGFGRLWLVRLVLLLLLVFLSLPRRTGSAAMWLRILLAGVLLASLAWVGHGTEGEGWTGVLHRAGDALHLLAAALWIGALVLLASVLIAARRGRRDAQEARDLLSRFSAIGLGVVTVLALTGIINARVLMGVEFPGGLFLTRYGQVLTAKLVLFGAMLLLAAGNRYVWTPRLAAALRARAGTNGALRLLTVSVLAEMLGGFAVLAAVAWLGTLPPVPE